MAILHVEPEPDNKVLSPASAQTPTTERARDGLEASPDRPATAPPSSTAVPGFYAALFDTSGTRLHQVGLVRLPGPTHAANYLGIATASVLRPPVCVCSPTPTL